MKKNLLVIIGLLMASIGFKTVLLPLNVNIGGFAGVSQILNHLYSIPYSISSALLNTCFFLYALKVHGILSVGRAIATTIFFNFLLDYIPQLDLPAMSSLGQYIIICCASVITGCGFGLILRGDSSTGGSDYLAEIICNTFKVLSHGAASTAINVSIVCSTAYLFGVDNFARAVVATILVNESVNITLYSKTSKTLPTSLRFFASCSTLLKRLIHKKDPHYQVFAPKVETVTTLDTNHLDIPKHI